MPGFNVTHFNVAPDHIGVLSKRLTVVKWAAKPGPQDPRGRKHRCYGAKKTSLKGALRAGQGLRQQTGHEGKEHSRSLGPQICSAQRVEEAGPKMVLLSGAQAIRLAPIPIDTFEAKRCQHPGAQFPSAFPPILPGHQIHPVLFPVENFLFWPWGVLWSAEAGPRVTWPARYTKSNHQKPVGC